MDTIGQDLRFAFRQLRRMPGFVITVVLTLALGVGANCAIFSLLDQALLRALPVKDPGALILLSNTGAWQGASSSFGGDIGRYFSYPMYRDLREKNEVFQDLAATSKAEGDVSVSEAGHTELKSGEIVSGNYFQLLGVTPILGRLFTTSDDGAAGANPVAVLSARYWQEHFGARPDVLGRSISTNGHPFQIIGVAPPSFQSAVWGQVPDVFLPMSMLDVAMPGAGDRLRNHQSRWLNIFGRLKPGQTLTSSEAALAPLWHALRAEELNAINTHSSRFTTEFLTNSRLHVLPGAQGLSYSRDSLQTPLLAVMGMALLVLCVAAVNVASLLLVRSAARVHEFSLRFALGAGGGRIFQQLLIEGLILGLTGGLLGLLLAPVTLHLLVNRLAGPDTSSAFSAALDLRLLLFTFSVTLLLSICFSIAPALQLKKPDLVSNLKQQSGTASGGTLVFRRVIVALQVGLSVVLLLGAGLFMRTMQNLRNTRAGFNTNNLVSFTLDPRLAGFPPAQVAPLHKQTLEALASAPGISSVGATTDPELEGSNSRSNVTVEGYQAAPEEVMDVESAYVTPAYLQTLQLPFIAGRGLQESDDAQHAHVVLVNQQFVERFLGGDPFKAIGRRVARGAGTGLDYALIVGVFMNAHHVTLRDAPAPTLLAPVNQATTPLPLNYYVRAQRPLADTEILIRRVVRGVSPELAIGSLRSMRLTIDETLRTESIIELLAIAFGLLAATLSGVGLYGVLAYNITQRTREIGVRMALGSTRLGVSRLVLGEVFLLAGIGLLIALPCGVALARLVHSQLYGVSSADPLTMVGVALLICVVALLAALGPARRASSIDPMRALRME